MDKVMAEGASPVGLVLPEPHVVWDAPKHYKNKFVMLRCSGDNCTVSANGSQQAIDHGWLISDDGYFCPIHKYNALYGKGEK